MAVWIQRQETGIGPRFGLYWRIRNGCLTGYAGFTRSESQAMVKRRELLKWLSEPDPLCTPELHKRVTELRAEGWTWREIEELTGVPMRSCQRVIADGEPRRCIEPRCGRYISGNGSFCPRHTHGDRTFTPAQQRVYRALHKHGLMTTEQIRLAVDPPSHRSLEKTLTRMVRMGVIERPVLGYYRLAKRQEQTADHKSA